MRHFGLGGGDHSGPWFWEAATYTLAATGAFVDHHVGGYGAEATGINQFKAYALVLEDDAFDVADVDMRVYESDCMGSPILYGSDLSFDSKSMVALGSVASGKSLCVRLNAAHIPTGQLRKVQLVVYYSADTLMR
jgi:hypothetical protein